MFKHQVSETLATLKSNISCPARKVPLLLLHRGVACVNTNVSF